MKENQNSLFYSLQQYFIFQFFLFFFYLSWIGILEAFEYGLFLNFLKIPAVGIRAINFVFLFPSNKRNVDRRWAFWGNAGRMWTPVLCPNPPTPKRPCATLAVYIYIYSKLLSTSIHVYQEKGKNRQNLEITTSRISLGEKEKKIGEGKKIKKRPTSSHQLKKIKRYAVRWSKEQKPTVKCCNTSTTNSAQYKSRVNYRNEITI